MDLLTVVMHELGHVLDLGSIDPQVAAHSLMTATLDTGTRRLPGTEFGGVPASLPAAPVSMGGSVSQTAIDGSTPFLFVSLIDSELESQWSQFDDSATGSAILPPTVQRGVRTAGEEPAGVAAGLLDTFFSAWDGDELGSNLIS